MGDTAQEVLESRATTKAKAIAGVRMARTTASPPAFLLPSSATPGKPQQESRWQGRTVVPSPSAGITGQNTGWRGGS